MPPQAGSLCQGGLDVHIAPSHLLSDLMQSALQAITASCEDVSLSRHPRRDHLGADIQQRRQHHDREDAIPVPIDAIFQTDVASKVDAR